jgi:hypothetical protein
MGVALELYVDGAYAGCRGRLPRTFDLRATHYEAILLPAPRPPMMSGPGKKVTLALRCAYNGSLSSLPVYAIGDQAARNFDLDVGNFWNGRLYGVLAALCVFSASTSCCSSSSSRARRRNLFFALTLLSSLSISPTLGVVVWPFKAAWVRGVARSCS